MQPIVDRREASDCSFRLSAGKCFRVEVPRQLIDHLRLPLVIQARRRARISERRVVQLCAKDEFPLRGANVVLRSGRPLAQFAALSGMTIVSSRASRS